MSFLFCEVPGVIDFVRTERRLGVAGARAVAGEWGVSVQWVQSFVLRDEKVLEIGFPMM